MFMSILNILNNNGISFSRDAEMDKYHNIDGLSFKDGCLTVSIDRQFKRYSLKEISPILEGINKRVEQF